MSSTPDTTLHAGMLRTELESPNVTVLLSERRFFDECSTES